MSVVLDASALLAFWFDESGADKVAAAIIEAGAMISAPNFAEALTKLVDRRPSLASQLPAVPPHQPGEASATLPGLPLPEGAVSVEPFTVGDAVLCAQLRPLTKPLGLSLGDRACLALAQRTSSPVLTADRAWATLSIGVAITVVR